MTTDFQIVSGTTVPKNYIWDIGNPLETTPTNIVADSTTEYISGYAPGLKVVFKSDIKDLIYTKTANNSISSTYIWNFGDYYNSVNNTIALDCVDSVVEHTYILPGKYNVSLTNIQSKEDLPELPGDDIKCGGRHRIGWYWDNLSCVNLQATTWDETNCAPPASAVNKRPKRWDDEGKCFQRYCKNWTWRDLNCNGRNPVFWYETYEYGDYYKRWQFEANNIACNPRDIPKITIDVTEQVALKPFIVEVLEVKPVAQIYTNTYPLTGYSPFIFSLSPKYTKTGSFPIDRIDWNPGDGSPIKTVTRYTKPDSNYFVYNNTYFSDPDDPRNYDFVYTLHRNTDVYPIFYPSLTCYSASTNSTDSCSIVVGPILLQPQNNNIELLKVKNTIKGDFYGIEVDKNITVLSTITENEIVLPPTPTEPSAPIRFLINSAPVIYFGNTGDAYPPEYIPGCEYVPSEPDLEFLATEELATNLFTYSEEFENIAWGKINTSVLSNVTEAPDGTLTGDKVIDNTTNGTHYLTRHYTVTPNTLYTMSIYIKGAERTRAIIYWGKSGSPFTRIGIDLNLTNGTFTTADASSPLLVTTRNVYDVGNGWFKVELGGIFDSTSTDGYFELRFHNGTTTSYAGNNSGYFVWGGQLQQRAYSIGYVKTTNTPNSTGILSPITLEDTTFLYK